MLSEYLAKNYLQPDKKLKKKEKLDQSFKITKKKSTKQVNLNNNEIKDKELPKKKNIGWKIVGTDEITTTPVINDNNEQRMASGAKAGLQTGAEVAQQIKEKEEREINYLKQQSKDQLGGNNETVYRDKSGSKVNIHDLKEKTRLNIEKEESERQLHLKELNMGLIQKLELQESKDKLINSSNSGLNKYADDLQLNNKLKEKEFEDDPLLSFKPSKSSKFVSKTGRKLYKSGFPENRFGIIPGYRWDGVDRSNGFEKSWFKKQLENQRIKTLSYTMQEDE